MRDVKNPTESQWERTGGSRTLGALSCLLLAILSFLAGRAVSAPADGPGVSLDEVEERLTRIENLLESQTRSLPSAGDAQIPAPRERRPTGRESQAVEVPRDAADSWTRDETLQVLAAIQRAQDELRAQLERTRAAIQNDTARTETLARLRDRAAPIDWFAWQEILDLWDSDPELARAEVKLLTEEEVIDRFGPPTDIWSNTNGITWQYARDPDPVTERYALDIILRMPAGYVTQLAVRRP